MDVRGRTGATGELLNRRIGEYQATLRARCRRHRLQRKPRRHERKQIPPTRAHLAQVGGGAAIIMDSLSDRGQELDRFDDAIGS